MLASFRRPIVAGALAASLWAGSSAHGSGVVVENARSGLSARAAGLQAGDILLRWERDAAPPENPEPAAGRLDTPFELQEVEREQAPRGRLRLFGTRAGAELVALMGPGEWGLETRPQLEDTQRARYDEARALVRGEHRERGLSAWRDLALELRQAHEYVGAAWLWQRLGAAAAEQRQWELADAALAEGVADARASGDVTVLALSFEALGRAFEERSSWELAQQAYQTELETYGDDPTRDLSRARGLTHVARMLWRRGDFRAAGEGYGRVFDVRARSAPDSLELAGALNNLGLIARALGDDAAAERHYRACLERGDRIAPESATVARCLYGLGNLLLHRSDLAGAEDMYARGLAIDKRLDPESGGVAGAYNNLGNVAHQRGDLAAAEDYARRALAIRERRAPGGPETADSLNNLGSVAFERGDLSAAADYFRRGLAIKQKLTPRDVGVAHALSNLGAVAWKRGDLDTAQDFFRRALALKEQALPGSLEVALGLESLGLLAEARGDLNAAQEQYTRALALRETLAPDGLEVAASLTQLGRTVLRRGDRAHAQALLERAFGIEARLAEVSGLRADTLQGLGETAEANGNADLAEANYQRALELRRQLSPGSADVAETCASLASLHEGRGEREPALEFHYCALDALETQGRRLGAGDELTASFTARHARYYYDTVALLMDLGRPAEALLVSERSRAQSFLALLAERDLVFAHDVPVELERERRAANADYDRALGRLRAVKTGDGGAPRQALDEARRRQRTAEEQIRASSPRLTALRRPEPLDLSAIRTALDPGTLLLSYSIGDERSYLFAVGPGPQDFDTYRLSTTRAELGAAVSRFREGLQGGPSLLTSRVQRTARALSEVLLAPAAARVARATRVLILPDGPLHLIPFAALADPTSRSGYRSFVEAKPLHVAASASVWAELRRAPHATRAHLVAFGDPDYSAAQRGLTARVPQEAVSRGLDLKPLPGTRREVTTIERLYGSAASAYLGDDATEERAKVAGAKASILHFACHGLADGAAPLESALALSLPAGDQAGRDNGLLQAWEIFEQVRIDADLVTLSACSTALGKEMSGEGMLGLTRAFQYAGARSVLASLWEVRDESTMRLMERFYRNLKKGSSKDQALRAAQLEVMRAPGGAHPRSWAAFQLIGDWR